MKKIIVLALLTAISLGGTPAATSAASASAMPTKEQKKAAKAANRALVKKVRSTLQKTQGLVASDITILANAGAVTLEGSVPDESQIQLAETATQGVTGVTSVSNYLRITIRN